MAKERRKFIRLDAKVAVKYRILKRGQPRKESESKDVGGGGIKLYINEELSKGTPVELEIRIPAESRSIFAKGQIVWSKEVESCAGERGTQWFDAGILFTKINSLDRCKILKYVYNHIY